MKTGFGACFERFPHGLGGGVLHEDVPVVADEVVMVEEVVKSEFRAVGDGGGPSAAGAGVGCWVLQLMRTRVRLRARAFPGDLCVLVPV